MRRQIVLGLGAGQCGTLLLAQILSKQPNARVTHEERPLLPWVKEPDAPGIRERLERICQTRRERLVGDVASFYLPYVEEAIRFDEGIRIVCLKRPCDEVVAGFCRFLDETSPFPTNHWAREPAPGWYHDPIWTRIFPQYDTQDRQEGIRRYWEEYYSRVEELVRCYPENIRVWDTEVLTTEQGVREVLSFVGIAEAEQVIVTGQRPPALDAARVVSTTGPRRRPLHPLDPRKCVILVPFTGFIYPECEDALKELERRGYPVRRVGGYAAIDQGRNQMATDALLDGFEETFWIDSDIGFHPDSVDQLRSHPHPIVCGVYPQKGRRALACHVMPGTPSMVFGKRGGLVEVLYAGTGFLLIRREVYLTIQRKLKLPVCNERFGHPMIPFFLPMIRPIEEGYWYLAEDYAFCYRARQCGYRIYADSSIRLWHIGTYRFGWEDAGLDRQRFATFTLNFGDAPPNPNGPPVPRSPALANLATQFPWPAQRPDVPAPPIQDEVGREAMDWAARGLLPSARLLLDVGPWSGRSTCLLAALAPHATVVAIHHWQPSPEPPTKPDCAPTASPLYQAFVAQCWNHRDRIIPLLAPPAEGLERIAEAGLQPEIVVIHGDEPSDALAKTLGVALDLFPTATIFGSDSGRHVVRAAVEEVLRDRGLTCAWHGPAWKVLRADPASAPIPPANSP